MEEIEDIFEDEEKLNRLAILYYNIKTMLKKKRYITDKMFVPAHLLRKYLAELYQINISQEQAQELTEYSEEVYPY